MGTRASPQLGVQVWRSLAEMAVLVQFSLGGQGFPAPSGKQGRVFFKQRKRTCIFFANQDSSTNERGSRPCCTAVPGILIAWASSKGLSPHKPQAGLLSTTEGQEGRSWIGLGFRGWDWDGDCIPCELAEPTRLPCTGESGWTLS